MKSATYYTLQKAPLSYFQILCEDAKLPTIFVRQMTASDTILIVCNRVPYPLKDGGAMAMYAMIKGWHDLGKKVHLLAMNTSRHQVAAAQLPDLFRQIAGFEMVEVDTEIRLIPTLKNYFFSKKPQHAERFYFKHFEERMIRTIDRVKPNFIQLESIYLQEYEMAIRSHSKALLAQRLHNIEAEIWQRLAEETPSFLKRIYLRNLSLRIATYEQKVWNHCDALIPISKTDEGHIKKTGCTTATCCIPFGIDSAKNQEKLEAHHWTAYHIGAMDWQPNIEAMEWMLDEIVPAILQLRPEFYFQFAGRNMPETFKRHQEPSFFCAGEVNNAETFIADKRMLIVPLRSGSGIRIKTLEAMAAGKIVISTSVGIQGIAAQDKIHFILANTAQEFASAVDWCLQHQQAAMNIAQQAQQLIKEEYNAQALMQKLSNFVEKLS